MKRLLAALFLLLLPLAGAAQSEPQNSAPEPSRAVPAPEPAPVAPAPENPWQGYPEREVERPILPAANGYLMTIMVSSFSASERFDDSGNREALPESIGVLNLDLVIDFGLSKSWEFFAGVPYTTAQTSDFSSGSVGNIYAGTRIALLTTDKLQLAAGLKLSLPTGDAEYHFHLDDGKVIPENFRTGNPGLDLYPELRLRYRAADDLSLRLRVMGIFTGSGETLLNAIGGDDVKRDINPGDGWRIDITALYQLSPRWVVPVGFDFFQLGETELSGLNFNDAQRLFEGHAGVILQVTPTFDIELGARLPLAGQNVYQAVPVGLELRTRF